MPTILASLQSFLSEQTVPGSDLIARWSTNLETQVLVAADDGHPVEGKRHTYTDGTDTWWNIRVPKNANSEPEWRDYQMRWSLNKHAEAIGSTGWDWFNRKSKWVGFDFDAITGHATGVGISANELAQVLTNARNVPYVEVRKSTGGKGLHLYVLLDDIPTANHTEHAALGRAILGMMSTEANFDFAQNVDACGGNMWIWHRKITPENEGLKLLKPADKTLTIDDLPINWRDHVDVVTRTRTKVRVTGIPDESQFNELTTSRKVIPLEQSHRQLISNLANMGYTTIWVPDHHLLQTHTAALKKLFVEQDIRGFFDTTSEGTDPGKPNCFMFPLPDGEWKVYRFGNTAEHSLWEQDGTWTWCYFNTQPDLVTAARAHGGVKTSTGGYAFSTSEDAVDALAALGHTVPLASQLTGREAHVKAARTGDTCVTVRRFSDEQDPGLPWVKKWGGWWEYCLDVQFNSLKKTRDLETRDADSIIRVVLTDNNKGVPFIRSTEGTWDQHSLPLVQKYLGSVGYDQTEVDDIIGQAVGRRWKLVNLPFKSEFPGGRVWNKGAAQFAVKPADEPGEHPHWDLIYAHLGQSLDDQLKHLDWARSANLCTGADYLRAIFAAMIREPFVPTPYVFLWGNQDSGKSILWEAWSKIVTKGVVRADRALTSDFNGELAHAWMCAVEEKDFSKNRAAANRVKDFVTSLKLSIRQMRTDAYQIPNCTHWFQFANYVQEAPIFDKRDTRITVIHVPDIPAGKEIPKPVLFDRLVDEAPAFLRTLLDLPLPEAKGRLRVPVIDTQDKQYVIEQNRCPLEMFTSEQAYIVNGAKVKFAEFYDRFLDWLPPEDRHQWSKQKVGKQLPMGCPSGLHNNNQKWIGNLSFAEVEPGPKWVLDGRSRLKQECA